MSDSFSIEILACWKFCHNCAKRKIGCVTRPDNMLKAISCPTDNSPFITRLAPIHKVSAMVIFCTSCTSCPAILLICDALKEDPT